jgi:hypothetical protein
MTIFDNATPVAYQVCICTLIDQSEVKEAEEHKMELVEAAEDATKSFQPLE